MAVKNKLNQLHDLCIESLRARQRHRWMDRAQHVVILRIDSTQEAHDFLTRQATIFKHGEQIRKTIDYLEHQRFHFVDVNTNRSSKKLCAAVHDGDPKPSRPVAQARTAGDRTL